MCQVIIIESHPQVCQGDREEHHKGSPWSTCGCDTRIGDEPSGVIQLLWSIDRIWQSQPKQQVCSLRVEFDSLPIGVHDFESVWIISINHIVWSARTSITSCVKWWNQLHHSRQSQNQWDANERVGTDEQELFALDVCKSPLQWGSIGISLLSCCWSDRESSPSDEGDVCCIRTHRFLQS